MTINTFEGNTFMDYHKAAVSNHLGDSGSAASAVFAQETAE